MKTRKRSMVVSLVLVGAASGCGNLEENRSAQRDVYESVADCQADWGSDEGSCEPVADDASAATRGTTGTSSSSYYRPTRYYGPHYTSGARPGSIRSSNGSTHTVGNRAASSHTVSRGSRGGSSGGSVSRGGFGHSAGSHGASS
jgi:hypothetical protein